MELFLENHGQYKKIVIKLIYIQSCTFRHFTKKCILKNMSEKTLRHIFLRKLSPKLYFRFEYNEGGLHAQIVQRKVLFGGIGNWRYPGF